MGIYSEYLDRQFSRISPIRSSCRFRSAASCSMEAVGSFACWQQKRARHGRSPSINRTSSPFRVRFQTCRGHRLSPRRKDPGRVHHHVGAKATAGPSPQIQRPRRRRLARIRLASSVRSRVLPYLPSRNQRVELAQLAVPAHDGSLCPLVAVHRIEREDHAHVLPHGL
jgi:hypothetical protein